MSRNMKKKIVFLPYDFDTAIGINNEGSLTFSYNLEDIDQVGNADVFNGQQSVLWKNLRETYFEELKAMYQQLRSQNKLSYALTETAFEEHQEKWPEALFNEDAWFKYLAPLEEKGSEAYLAMLQGSKAEQRKWWLYNRFKYIDSKYNAGDALTDVITLRGYAKADISVTPYADIYPTVKFGSYLVQARGTRNVATTLVCPLDNVNDTEIYIYSASQLASVGDLSGLKVGYGEFAYATRLQELKIGDSSSSYSNPNLETLYLGNNTLLKKLDVRNCSGLGNGDQKTVDISGCLNIEEVYFDGTNILGVSLPNGGFLKKLHLPGTITNLTVRNQTMVTEFVCPDYSNITTLFLEHTSSAIDVADIVADMVAGSRIRLFNFYWDFESTTAVDTFLALFSGMKGMDQNGNETPTPQIFATIHVPSATGDWIDSIHEDFPDITIDADVATYYLRYYNWEGTTLLYTESVAKGQNGTYSSTPSHDSTAQYTFTFVGWNRYKNSTTADSTARNNIQSNRNVYAAYTTTVRTYTVTFKNSDYTTLQTVNNVPYGGTATYTGSNPTHPTDPNNMRFIGFVPTGANITGDTNCIAQYQDLNSPVVKYLAGSLTNYVSGQNATKIARYAFVEYYNLKTVETYATEIEDYAFQTCSGLTKLDLKNQNSSITIKAADFPSASTFNEIFIRSTVGITIGDANLPVTFKTGKGVIYVPDAKVSDYRSYAKLNGYHVYGISEYPVTDFDSIKDTLSEMAAKIANGTATYVVGDTKTIDLVTEGKITFAIVATNADELSSGGSNAAYTFIAQTGLATKSRYNPTLSTGTEGTGTLGGWEKSELRSYLSTTIWDLLPSELKTAIKEVKKYSYSYDANGSGINNVITNDKLWIPSFREVCSSSGVETLGATYTDVFNSSSARVRSRYGSSAAGETWWLRTPYNTNSEREIYSSGSNDYDSVQNTRNIIIGFCL